MTNTPPATAPASGLFSIADMLAGGKSTVAQAGDDIMLTNVISFDVKVLQEGYDPYNLDPTNHFVPLFIDLPPPSSSNNTTFSAGNVGVFDTWCQQGNYSTWNAATPSAYTVPLKIRILALQITLRVWDDRTQQARQMTIIQDM
jgi:hypothetical protein